MAKVAHDLFLLTTNLSQLKSKEQTIHLFIESIKTIFTSKNFSWHEEKENIPAPNFPICTRMRTYGFLHFEKSLQKDAESYALLQNASQLLAIMLERIHLEEFLNDQKNHLQYLVNEKTREYSALNEENQVINEELTEGSRNLQQINDKLAAEVMERERMQNELKTMLHRFEIHISSLYAGVLVVSEDGKVENVNQAFCDLFNLSEPPSRFIGLTSPEMVEKIFDKYADPDGTLARMQKIIADENPVRGEEIAMRDGRYYMVDFIPIKVDAMKYGHIWHHQDITKRKLAEETFFKNEESQHNILENGGIGVAYYDLDGLILMLNKKAVSNLGGTDARQFVGKSLFELFGNEVGGAFVERLRKVATSPEPVEFEDRTMMPSGVRWYLSVHSRSVDSNGNPTGVHVYAHDITQRKQVEEALRESKEYLENLFNYANAPIIVWDPQFRITRFNHAFEFLTGRNETEVIGQSLEILFPPELIENSMTLIRKTLTGERWETVEIKIQHRDKSVRTVLWNSATLFGQDGKTPVATIAQGQEITKRKLAEAEINFKNEELQKLNAEKDKFFSVLAHDLRSPFNSFLGLTQMMAEELSTMTLDEIQKIAINMRKSATNIYNLLTNLLDWSRLQRGVTGFQPESFLLLPKITECIESVSEAAIKKGIDIRVDIPEDLGFFADIHMVQTIIRNLASNAVKYTNKGGKVEISAKMIENDSLEISVKDTGIGIPGEMIGQLFQLDQSINRAGTDGEPSTGLGLIICKEFVEKHNGTIWVESMETGMSTGQAGFPAGSPADKNGIGGGTTFYFIIPGQK
jgi:PAS domain S-box-containing protein